MKFIKLVAMYTILFLVAFIMAGLGISPWITFSVVIFGVLLYFYFYIDTLYFTKNMKRVDKLIIEKRNNPIFNHVYSIVYGTKEDEIAAIDDVLEKYKQPLVRHTYLFNRAIRLDDLTTAEHEARQITKKTYQSYSLAYVEALKGNKDSARAYKIQKEWMKHAIEALIANEEKDSARFKSEVKKCINSSRGLQRYQIIHGFRKMEEESI